MCVSCRFPRRLHREGDFVRETSTGEASIETERPTADREDDHGEPRFDDTLPSTGLLSFYDRLRDRIVEELERRGGTVGSRGAQALLLVPDVFILVVRLSLDRDVPRGQRAMLASALAYFVLPVDVVPEAFVGPAGYIDDLIFSLAIIAQAFGKDLEPHAEKYWSGNQKVRTVLRDVLGTAESLLGHSVYDRLRELLARKGIDLDDQRVSG